MKNIILIVLLLWSGVGVWAQDKLTDEKRKEFDAQKVAFFTQELDLSPAEAAVFWPLYNEMQKKNFIDSCSINSAANPALRNKPKKIE